MKRRRHLIPKIESGVRMPPRTKQLYPWLEMNVGDSLWFPNRDSWDINVMRWKAQKRTGYRLSQRKLKDGIRVWRVK